MNSIIKKASLIILPIVGLFFLVKAQVFNRTDTQAKVVEITEGVDSNFYRIYQLELDKSHSNSISFSKEVSSFSIEWLGDSDSTAYVVLPDNELFNIGVSSNEEGEKRLFSRLVIPNQDVKSIVLKSNASSGKILIHALSVPPIDISKPDNSSRKLAKKSGLCNQPKWISFDDWRKGLPDPKTGRISTQVNHCIIHHSAVASTDTDYVKRIRNIYTFHTQTRGWDDIGYNFLVAPNGDLFAGRDPQGVDLQDQIQGAHYCGKNSGTMGICMMGDYMLKPPSDTSLQTLKALMTWKLYKDGNSAFAKHRHPSEVGDYLESIAGHRDGCATACPGDSLYPLIETLREEVQDALNKCIAASVFEPNDHRGIKIWPNPASSYLNITLKIDQAKSYQIHDLSGKLVLEGSLYPNKKLDIRELQRGIYVLRIENIGSWKFIKNNVAY